MTTRRSARIMLPSRRPSPAYTAHLRASGRPPRFVRAISAVLDWLLRNLLRSSMPTTGSKRAARVISWLREQVTSGAWPIGTKIPTEPELTEQLGVGRSTVREAVRALASLGILETAPGRGTFVRSSSPVSAVLTDYLGEKEISDVLGIRRTLEIEAARKAALDLSDEHIDALRRALEEEREHVQSGHTEALDPPGPFHVALVQASGNPLLTELYQGLAHAVKLGIRDGKVKSSPADEKLRDHERIFEAVVKHDLVEAVHAANDHGDRDLVVVPSDGETSDNGSSAASPAEPPAVYRRIDTRRGGSLSPVRIFRAPDDAR
ncbi:FadR family transcriptional regulator [Pseudoclavibacter sp. CFCC 14310]|nr:FadR family transcriptional regulator [Pseudoclavibacter sp. CFCC 14310]KAB1664078.1 FadR family transcriptional regulator [Pseudoclavibacter sp. CFCC 13611]